MYMHYMYLADWVHVMLRSASASSSLQPTWLSMKNITMDEENGGYFEDQIVWFVQMNKFCRVSEFLTTN